MRFVRNGIGIPLHVPLLATSETAQGQSAKLEEAGLAGGANEVIASLAPQ
jgi:hypothetical protein